jgi:hypothetical protein
MTDGYKTARFLTEICHNLDPTRPVSAGFKPMLPLKTVWLPKWM